MHGEPDRAGPVIMFTQGRAAPRGDDKDHDHLHEDQ